MNGISREQRLKIHVRSGRRGIVVSGGCAPKQALQQASGPVNKIPRLGAARQTSRRQTDRVSRPPALP